MKVRGIACVLVVVMLFCFLPTAYAEGETPLNVFWKDGLHIDSADKRIQLRIGGRIQNDWVLWSGTKDIEDALGDNISSGTEFRRARLYLGGTMYERLIFMAEYDFAEGDSAFKDVFVGITKVPVAGTVRVGHFKEPFSLEELGSDNFSTFVERGLPNIFAPSRQTGLGMNNAFFDQRVTVGLSVFNLTDSVSGNSTGDNFQFAGRVTGLPFYAKDGAQLLHLGFSYWYVNPDDSEWRVRQRPEVHLSPRWVDTGVFGSDDVNNVSVEAAAMWGPFSVQGEYMFADVNSKTTATLPNTNDPFLSGFYVAASWVITGEHRSYKRDEAAFSGVDPERDFLRGGYGAFEVAARYSQLDLDNEGVSGGLLNDETVGINWYLNPNARVMLDYVHADLDHVGSADAVVTRFQVQL
jgi:phosphate-selective porin OprO/OprP